MAETDDYMLDSNLDESPIIMNHRWAYQHSSAMISSINNNFTFKLLWSC